MATSTFTPPNVFNKITSFQTFFSKTPSSSSTIVTDSQTTDLPSSQTIKLSLEVELYDCKNYLITTFSLTDLKTLLSSIKAKSKIIQIDQKWERILNVLNESEVGKKLDDHWMVMEGNHHHRHHRRNKLSSLDENNQDYYRTIMKNRNDNSSDENDPNQNNHFDEISPPTNSNTNTTTTTNQNRVSTWTFSSQGICVPQEFNDGGMEDDDSSNSGGSSSGIGTTTSGGGGMFYLTPQKLNEVLEQIAIRVTTFKNDDRIFKNFKGRMMFESELEDLLVKIGMNLKKKPPTNNNTSTTSKQQSSATATTTTSSISQNWREREPTQSSRPRPRPPPLTIITPSSSNSSLTETTTKLYNNHHHHHHHHHSHPNNLSFKSSWLSPAATPISPSMVSSNWRQRTT